MHEYLGKAMAGHQGEDSMRNNAKKMFASELSDSKGKVRMSASSTGREKLRPYAKGGKVVRHKLTKTQTDMKLPRRVKTPKLNIETFAEAEKMRRGGKAKSVASLHRKELAGLNKIKREISEEKRVRKNMGGRLMGANPATYSPMPVMAKKGGKVKKKYADGGLMGTIGRAIGTARKYAPMAQKAVGMARQYAPAIQEGISRFSPGAAEKFGRFRSAVGLKKGGTAYESEMMGEKPGRSKHVNYESEMKGEHGRMVKSRTGYAMGGAGKIRHKVMTRHGKPIHQKRGK